MRKNKFRKFLVFILVFAWLFTGWPKIQEVSAAGCTTAALGTGTDVAAATIAPGSAIADRGVFTITGSGTSCSVKVTAITVTLAASGTPYVGLAEVRITNSAGSTTYFSAVTSFSSNSVSFSGGTTIPIGIASAGAVVFKIRVTPLTHANMPAVPGASYDIAPYVSAWTTTLTKSGSDTNPNTTTIDNLSPSNVSASTATAGTQKVDLAWTNPGDADVTTGGTIVVLRNTSAVADTPVEGTTYSVGNSINTSYVACVVTGSPPATTCSDTGLTAGTPYHYKIFAQDSRGNYSQNGVVPTGSPATPTSTTTLSTSSDPASATVAPGSGIRSAGQFTLTATNGTDTITALTLTLAGSPTGSYAAADSISIRSTSCSGTLYFSAVTPSSDSVSFSGGTALPVTTGGNTYYICVTPKDHTLAVGTYSLSSYVSSTWTSSNPNTKAGADTNANALTIDNAPPNGATSTSGSAGVTNVTLNWTTSNSGDFATTNGSVVLRWAAGSAGNAVPVEGKTDYVAGNTIIGGDSQTATVACVISSAASTALSKVDGVGGSSGCNTSALTGGQAYSYKVFQADTNGNYDAGITIGSFTPIALVISVTITANGTIAYGALDFSVSKSTVTLGTTPIAKNDGNVAEDFTIKSSAATAGTGTNWALGSSPGTNIFVHEFSSNSGGLWTKFTTADEYSLTPLVTNIAVNGTQNFDLRITTPSSSDAVQKTITVTILATKH